MAPRLDPLAVLEVVVALLGRHRLALEVGRVRRPPASRDLRDGQHHGLLWGCARKASPTVRVAGCRTAASWPQTAP